MRANNRLPNNQTSVLEFMTDKTTYANNTTLFLLFVNTKYNVSSVQILTKASTIKLALGQYFGLCWAPQYYAFLTRFTFFSPLRELPFDEDLDGLFGVLTPQC